MIMSTTIAGVVTNGVVVPNRRCGRAKVEVTVVLDQAKPCRLSMLEFLETLLRGRALSRPGKNTNTTCVRRKTSGIADLASNGLVYLDANPIIYSVEKHPAYGLCLVPLWRPHRHNPSKS